MPSITTFIAFNDRAEEAAKFYCSIFKDSRIKNVVPYPPDSQHAPSAGAVMIVEVELLGKDYVFMNGGPHFKLTDSLSLAVGCDTQGEIDQFWEALVAGGGKHGPCGWLTDRFGMSWQVNPRHMSELIGKNDPQRAKRVMDAVMAMGKIDLATLEKAARG